MRALSLALLLLAGPALAQDEATEPETTGLRTAALGETPEAEGSMYLTEDIVGQRFADSDEEGGDFDDGEEVTVLVVADDLVRVTNGREFAWVPRDLLTFDEPADAKPATTPKLPGSSGKSFDSSALKDLLDTTKDL